MAVRKCLGRLALAGLLATLSLLGQLSSAVASPAGYSYLSPTPGSTRILPQTNIILRPDASFDPSLLMGASQIEVQGSISGPCSGSVHLSDDRSTVTFRPDRPFAFGEDVTVRVASTGAGGPSPLEFRFTIVGPEHDALRSFRIPDEDDGGLSATSGASGATGVASAKSAAGVSSASGVSRSAATPLPADFPKITTTISGTPSPGRLFISSFDPADPGATPYLMILDNDGTPFFYKPLVGAGHDFKLQPNGLLTYFDPVLDGFYALDSTYAVVDSFQCGNGYQTDFHDCRILPNGHVLLLSYDPQIVDMTPYNPKYQPDAVVIGLVIQEIDRDKNVVFQWRSWDHFAITDAVDIPLGSRTIDLIHGNAIDADSNGDLLLSSRNLNELTKISRATGDILWRLGGKNNQFKFSNDQDGFSRQHAARWLPDGHITLFDNGSNRTPPYSRAVEYDLDESKMVAHMDWDYRHDPDVFSPFAGYVQRLSTGNTLIGWGVTNPTLTEVTPSGKLVEEMNLPQGVYSYRAYRFEYPPMLSALVDFSPKTLNTNITTGTVKATISPLGFDASTIEVSSIRLEGVVPADPLGATLSDANGQRDLTVTFDRAALTQLLTPGTIDLEVTGTLTTGQHFHGSGSVLVQESSTRAVQVVSLPGATNVELIVGGTNEGAEIPVAIFDVRGRLVKRWVARTGADGRVVWDGRRGDGVRAAGGIYFVRAGSRESGAVARVVLTQ